MTRHRSLLCCLFVFAVASYSIAATDSLYGYKPESSNAEREWETKFRTLPSPVKAREYMEILTARPHHVGSPYDKQNAEWHPGEI